MKCGWSALQRTSREYLVVKCCAADWDSGFNVYSDFNVDSDFKVDSDFNVDSDSDFNLDSETVFNVELDSGL